VKRYVAETGRQEVLAAFRKRPVAVCRMSEAEIVSALARRSREGSVDPRVLERTVRAVRSDFLSFLVVEVTSAVVDRSVGLLLRYPLRAADSLQLAAALELRELTGEEIHFVAFDDRLNEAARSERLVEPAH
jgi:predicted nucleic acid-binding protein